MPEGYDTSGEQRMRKVEQILQEIAQLGPKEKRAFMKALLAQGGIALDPFALVRAAIPKEVTDREVEEILGQALRRLRHPTAAARGNRQKGIAQ
jgi:hypothetical protein